VRAYLAEDVYQKKKGKFNTKAFFLKLQQEGKGEVNTGCKM